MSPCGQSRGGEDGELFQSKEARDGNSSGSHRIDTAAPIPCIRLCASVFGTRIIQHNWLGLIQTRFPHQSQITKGKRK